MSDDYSDLDLLAVLDGTDTVPCDLPHQVASNIDAVRLGLSLAQAEPEKGKQAWHDEQGKTCGRSGRMVRHLIAAARSLEKCRGREPVPLSLVEGSIKRLPENVEKFLQESGSLTKRAKLERWKHRADGVLSCLDDAGSLKERLATAQSYLEAVTNKVAELEAAAAHAESQPRLRHPELRDAPFVLVAWQGASAIDGAPIRVVASCLRNTSGSRKTGDMIPVIITRDDLAPSAAIAGGCDESVCGDCLHRPRPHGLGTCYVVVAKRSVKVPWDATHDVEQNLQATVEAIKNAGVPVRLGTYGNPSAMPFGIAQALVEVTRDHRSRLRHTSFEHLWRTCDPQWSSLSMASVDTSLERDEAKSKGWRTFRVKLPEDSVLTGEIVCPGSDEAGKRVTCSECLLCSGTDGRGTKDIVLDIHGSGGKVRRYRAWKDSGQSSEDDFLRHLEKDQE